MSPNMSGSSSAEKGVIIPTAKYSFLIEILRPSQSLCRIWQWDQLPKGRDTPVGIVSVGYPLYTEAVHPGRALLSVGSGSGCRTNNSPQMTRPSANSKLSPSSFIVAIIVDSVGATYTIPPVVAAERLWAVQRTRRPCTPPAIEPAGSSRRRDSHGRQFDRARLAYRVRRPNASGRSRVRERISARNTPRSQFAGRGKRSHVD